MQMLLNLPKCQNLLLLKWIINIKVQIHQYKINNKYYLHK